MSWSASGLFRQTFIDILDGTLTTADLDATNMCKVALFNNSVTPDFDAAASSIAYNTGTWTTGNEVSSAGQWDAGGIVLPSADVLGITGGLKFDASDVSSGASATMSNIYGCLIYLDAVTTPVANQGLLAVYFGGAFSVSSGTFTIQWHTDGIFTLDLA